MAKRGGGVAAVAPPCFFENFVYHYLKKNIKVYMLSVSPASRKKRVLSLVVFRFSVLCSSPTEVFSYLFSFCSPFFLFNI